jgi:peptidoglycan/LPS O-acetylase OafA/YrhL
MGKPATIDSFEGARGFAALLVGLYHFCLFDASGMAYPEFVRHGYLFVDLFFVLSGFVICSSYERRLNDGSEFWIFVVRRFGRLFPLLAVSTLLFVLLPNLYVLAKHVLIALGHQGMFRTLETTYTIPSAAEILTTLTMTHGLGMFDHVILNYASWSISTEFYTYLLFASVCIALPQRVRVATFVVLSVVAYGITCWASVSWHDCIAKSSCLDVTYDFGLTRCVASFFMGCLACRAARHVAPYANALQCGSMLLIVVAFIALEYLPVLALAMPLVFTLLIVSLATDQGYVARLFKTRTAQMLGQRSYSIYLMHPILICIVGYTVHGISSALHGVIVLLVFVAALIAVSGLTYRFIEVPPRDAFNRLAARIRTARDTDEYFARRDSAGG